MTPKKLSPELATQRNIFSVSLYLVSNLSPFEASATVQTTYLTVLVEAPATLIFVLNPNHSATTAMYFFFTLIYRVC